VVAPSTHTDNCRHPDTSSRARQGSAYVLLPLARRRRSPAFNGVWCEGPDVPAATIKALIDEVAGAGAVHRLLEDALLRYVSEDALGLGLLQCYVAEPDRQPVATGAVATHGAYT
jgi:hypothetical protein